MIMVFIEIILCMNIFRKKTKTNLFRDKIVTMAILFLKMANSHFLCNGKLTV